MIVHNVFIRILSAFIYNPVKRRRFRKKHLIQKVQVPPDNNSIIIIQENGQRKTVQSVPGLNIEWLGKNSQVILSEKTIFHNCHFAVGDNNIIEIAKTPYKINNMDIPFKMSDGSSLKIDEDFSCAGLKLYLHDEPNTNIKIGKDCMFSFDIILWPSDGHTIISALNGKCLNKPSKGISIGNHCWVCRNVCFLKDSGVGDNTVCGTSALVTKIFQKTNVIIAGIPAKIIRESINWNRDNTYEYEWKRKNDKQ